MLSRNAEALYWLGRYIERVENHTRMIDVLYHIRSEGNGSIDQGKWARLVDILGARDAFEGVFNKYKEKDALFFLTLDTDYGNSLISCLSKARANLRSLREILPTELWDTLNQFYMWLKEADIEDILRHSPHLFFCRVKEWSGLFYGIQHSVMLRSDEWHFLETGRSLERAENSVRILLSVWSTVKNEQESVYYPYLQGVLRSVSGYQAFRKFHADAVTVDAINEFLLLNQLFPRSVYFSFTALDHHLRSLQYTVLEVKGPREKVIRLAGKVKADLECLEKEELTGEAAGEVLNKLLDTNQKLGLALAKAFFPLEEGQA
ncbi:MAG: alpha-E domain-containing protein [Gorillibacterium sp.]|nr:alpha-E domain-containing protein [Gorillibacterium sp.]